MAPAASFGVAPVGHDSGGASVSLSSRPLLLWRYGGGRFALVFAMIAGCLLALYYFPRSSEDTIERWTAEYLHLYSCMVSRAVGIFDPNVSVHGNLVAGRFSMEIVKSCDAMEVNILFAAALLAVRARWWRKAVALVVGLAALVAFNVVRLVVLYCVGVFAFSAFELLHYDVWPLLMIAFATLDFVACVRWALGPGAASMHDPVDRHVAA